MGWGLKGNSVGIVAILATGLLIACTKVEDLTPLDQVKINNTETSAVTVNFCTDPTFTPQQTLKMLIILDHSGSNKLNYEMAADGTGAPAVVNGDLVVGTQYATDPTGNTRYGSITSPGTLLNYLSTVPVNSDPTNPTRFFALIDFNGSEQTYPAGAMGFTSDTTAFFNYVQQDAMAGGTSPNDGGDTDYLGALTKAYNIINSDIQAAQNCAAGSVPQGPLCPKPGVTVSSSYVIVFMSDGAPISSLSGVTVIGGQYVVTGTLAYTIEATDQILGEVAAITALTENSAYVTGINLFTIYYYIQSNIDQAGQTLLSEMAKAGNGIFYNVVTGTNIDYTQFEPPVKQVKYNLADVIVTNSSVTWWDDGNLHKDTDMDGLPDDVEVAWGSDPTTPFTQVYGVSDLVRYRSTNGAACVSMGGNGICADAPTHYNTGTCSTIANTPVGGKVVFVSDDPDGLNNCEKKILNDFAGINNPDSNSDLLSDWLEFIAGVPFQFGTAPAVNTPDQDGYTVYQKIKYSLPQNISAQQELNLTPANYQLNLLNSSDTQDCYKLVVNNLPIMGSNNTVRVDVIEKSSLSNVDYLYKIGKKAFSGSSLDLTFNDWTDPGEITAGTWKVWPAP